MVKRLRSFNASQKISVKGGDKLLASKSPDVLRAELSKINTDIAAIE
jgi:hypothetical protein